MSPCRLAIVGTPRSGNMWLRRLLASWCGLEELAADTPAQVPWGALPVNCVLQLHWHPREPLLSLLERHGFRTLALTRHPLDVLVSILQFAQRETRTARWLNGEAGDERLLLGADTCSARFREYSCGPRARALLETTVLWRRSERLSAALSYEELVAAPERELPRLGETLGLVPVESVDAAVTANGFAELQTQTANGHFWRGSPGNWHVLVTVTVAEKIAAAHESSFVELGYELDPDPALTEEEARANWIRMTNATPSPVKPPADRARMSVELAARPSEELIRTAYRLILRRTPDAPAFERARQALHEGTLSTATLIRELATSTEAEQVRLLDDALALAGWARHANERPRELTAPAWGSERLIEIPWTLARYRGEASVLDVGYAFAEPAYLATLPSLGARRLVAVDLAELAVPGVETITADVRALPFPAETFEIGLCISTLQHIGYDNRVFGLAAEDDIDGPRRALQELRRVLKPTGRLLVTVPCGEPQALGWFVQHSREGWRRLFAAADLYPFEEQVYELTDASWRPAPDFTGRGVRYAERGAGASALLCAELRPGRRRQATRRAFRHTRRRLRGKTTDDR